MKKDHCILLITGIFIFSFYLPWGVLAAEDVITDCARASCPKGYSCLRFGEGREVVCSTGDYAPPCSESSACSVGKTCMYDYTSGVKSESGACFTVVRPTLKPASPAVTKPAPTKPVVVLDPEAATALEFLNSMTNSPVSVADFAELIKRYRSEIHDGKYTEDNLPGPLKILGIKPGQVNNLMNGANETACGGYQGSILKFLLSLKFSDDPVAQGLLSKLDFGPIQIEKGGHQAVVIFPKGTDWRLSGVVLDPWVDQKPRMYNIEEWQGMFAMGITSPEGSGGWRSEYGAPNLSYYPTTPDEDGEWKYVDVYSNKPIRPERTVKMKTVLTSSPVLPLVTSLDGKRVGIDSDGAFVNDFGLDVDAYIFKKADGTYSSTFTLPEGDYAVKLTATGSGDVHVFNHLAGSDAVTAFDPVSVNEGNVIDLTWEESAAVGQLNDPGGKMVKSGDLAISGAATANGGISYTSILVDILILVILVLAYFWWRRRS